MEKLFVDLLSKCQNYTFCIIFRYMEIFPHRRHVGAEAQASRQPCAGRGFCLRHHNFLFRPCCFGDKSVSAESRKCAFGPFSAEDFRWPKFRCIPNLNLQHAGGRSQIGFFTWSHYSLVKPEVLMYIWTLMTRLTMIR